ncbi:MAG: GNAT family N-acetyltransferase [Firmicutes bacterium]|nr:GNAT family N-acetyltransferase [Bacillota bacterium]
MTINKKDINPLLLDGWLEFNRVKWGVKPVRVKFKAPNDAEVPSIEVVFFLNAKGKICVPPRNPYLGINFNPTPTDKQARLSNQWLEVADYLVEEMRDRGLASTIGLPPHITDVRPWQWNGFKAGVKYTFCETFPYDINRAYRSVRKNINKAIKAGYVCSRTKDMNHVLPCLLETEERQGFDHQLTIKDLELCSELLGDDHFRTYICYAPNGEPACAYIWLHCRGARAIGWVGGTRQSYQHSGVTQFIIKYSIDDLNVAGATSIDLTGANIPSVAASKLQWGFKLTPYYTLGAYGIKQMAIWVRDWLNY